MPVPNVNTFEHDIADEIEHREATVTDIASASGDVKNIPNQQLETSKLFLVLGGVAVIAVIIVVAALFLYSSPSTSQTITTPVTDENPGNDLLSLSLNLRDNIGSYIGSVQKSEYGYTLTVLNYSPVFAHMIKNENQYADELAIALQVHETATTTPVYTFTDVTRNNQNMRVGSSGSSTVVYAFVNTKYLLISSSPEGILTLRGGILTR